jgi:DNA-binding response OmpR family regulator
MSELHNASDASEALPYTPGLAHSGPDFEVVALNGTKLRRQIGLTAVQERFGYTDTDDRHHDLAFADDRIRLSIGATRFEAIVDELPTHVSAIQFSIAYFLAQNVDRYVPANDILRKIWKYEDESTFNCLKATMATTRRQLGDELGNHLTGAIRRRRGMGYIAKSTLR